MRALTTGLLLLFVCSLPARAEDPDFLVDTEWVEQQLHNDRLVILEARYHPHRYHTIGHLPGAIQVQRFRDLGDNGADPVIRFPSREAFQATLRRWGVNDDSLLLLYDDSRSAIASRIYFLLELYGFPMGQVKILDGGTTEWTVFHELDREPVTPDPGNVTLQPAKPELLVEWTEIYDAVLSRRDPGVTLIDARTAPMYRGGHIPGAVNIVSLDGTDSQSQQWLPHERIAGLYCSIPQERRVYVHCDDGFRMTLAWLQLKYLGYKDVRLYNGGWAHWGNQRSLPVVEGERPYDAEYAL